MISKIEIENFKSIKKIDIELKKINILIGANGSGKTNFINYFNLLKNIYNQNLARYLAKEGDADNILYYGLKNSQYINSRIEFSQKNAYSFKLIMGNNGNLYLAEEDAEFYVPKPGRWDHQIFSSNEKESKLKEYSQSRYFYVNEYMKEFRIYHFHDTSKESKIKRPSDINDNKYFRENGENLAAFLYWLKVKHPKNLKSIELVIQSVMPSFKEFVLEPSKLNDDLIFLEWLEEDYEKYFNINQLSDGSLRFIALTTLLLQPTPPKVIIIDEPELGLHPFAIYKLSEMMKMVSDKTQIIISTQSVNLVDNFSPDDIIIVDKKNNSTQLTRPNESVYKNWLNDFTLSEIWTNNVIGGLP